MRRIHREYYGTVFLSMLALTACSSGGSGGAAVAVNTPTAGATSTSTSGSTNSSTSGTGATPSPTLTIEAAAIPTLGGNNALEESGDNMVGTGPIGTAGTLPPTGTVFPLRQSAMAYNYNSASTADATNSGGGTLTYLGKVNIDISTGMPTSNITGYTLPNYELKIPALGIDAVVPLATVDNPIISNGYLVTSGAQFLNYMLAGSWDLGNTSASSGKISYHGAFTTGFQTPVSGVPTTGQAVYASSPSGSQANAQGSMFMNSSQSVQGALAGTVAGSATVTVNFSSGAVNGSITSTVVQPGGGFGVSWNNVGLTGTLSGATVGGTTAVTSVPTSGGPATFDASATGTFNGALYGPAGQELGIVWSLHDPTGQGKTALGVIAGERSN